MDGYAGNILLINLSTSVHRVVSSQEYLPTFLGGRVLAAKLAWDVIPADTGPFDEDNCIIITTGPLAGTIAPSSGRTVMASISPVPRPFPWYTHSTLGGWFAGEMKAAGYDGIVIRGKAEEPTVIVVQDAKVSIVPWSRVWGSDAFETQELMQERFGKEAHVLAIGPAGENRVLWSTVQHNFDNAAGHSGFGAVWGAKHLKALVLRGTGSFAVNNPEELFHVWRRNGRYRINSEQKFLLYDSDAGETARDRVPGPVCSQSCVNNCHQGRYLEEESGNPGETKVFNTFCIGPVFLDNMLPTAYKREGAPFSLPAVPTGSREDRVAMVTLCNRLGIDLWMRISLHSWLLMVRNEGITELGGYPIEPESTEWFLSFVRDVAYRKGLGASFSDGLHQAVEYVKHDLTPAAIKAAEEILFGYGFHAHREGRFWDKTPLPFWLCSAMMYANETRDPTIGSHTLMHLSDILLSRPEEAKKKFTRLGEELWGTPTALLPNYNFREKAKVAIWCQRQHMQIDSLPLCDFAFPMLIKPFDSLKKWQDCEHIRGDLELGLDLFNAITGLDWDEKKLSEAADRGLALERMLLARAGRTRKQEDRLASHFTLPCREDGTSITAEQFTTMMDDFYLEKGWALTDGLPTVETLERLGLHDCVALLTMVRAAK